MKYALPLLLALALPLSAFAGDPKDPAPAGYTLIPLGDVKVISVQDMMKSGGLITAEGFQSTGRAKKKKKKRSALPPKTAVAAGLFGIAAAASGNSGGGSAAPVSPTTSLDARAPELPGTMITRAVDTPEPGTAAVCLLLLPVVAGYFRTRSKNA